MIIRRNFGLDVGSRYEITGTNVHIREGFGNTSISIDLRGVTLKKERKGLIGALFDFGDVSIRRDGVEQHRCTNVFRVSRFYHTLKNAAQGYISFEEQKRQKRKTRRQLKKKEKEVKRVYQRAWASTGEKRLHYAQEFLQMIKTCSQEEVGVVYQYGSDIFVMTQGWDRTQQLFVELDSYTKRALHPIGLEFQGVSRERGYGTRYEDRLLDEVLLQGKYT